MKFTQTSLPDVIYIQPQSFQDDRGFFFEAYHAKKFQDSGLPYLFLQDNQSYSTQDVLRGLHYQLPPKGQGKLVRVLSGEIFDVAVDIRPDSPHFKQWIGITLSEKKKNMLYIPPGFAHGFFVTSQSATVLYKCTELYTPHLESSIRWDDPTIGIKWPKSIHGEYKLSEKDKAAPLLSEAIK